VSDAPEPTTADTSSSSAAGNWIRAQWEKWKRLELEFPRLQHRAALVRAGSSDPETRAAAAESIERLGRLASMHAYLTEKVQAIAGLIPNGGLGAVSIVWPIAVVGLAVSVAWVITHYDAELRIVQMLEGDELTAAEARQLLAEVEGGGALISAGGVLSLPVLAAVGLGVWWLWPLLSRTRRR